MSKGKKVSRRKVKAWLDPIRKTLNEILHGDVDCMRGYAVTRLDENDTYARIDYCIAGFRGILSRLCPEIEDGALLRVEKKLANGTPLFAYEIQECFVLLKRCENALIRKTVDEVKEAVLVEQIMIELEEIETERKVA